MKKPTALARDLDAAWIVALWMAIHSDDPPPPIEVIITEVIAALAKTAVGLRSEPRDATFTELRERMKEIHVDVQAQPLGNGKAVRIEGIQPEGAHCLLFRGQRIYITMPTVKP